MHQNPKFLDATLGSFGPRHQGGQIPKEFKDEGEGRSCGEGGGRTDEFPARPEGREEMETCRHHAVCERAVDPRGGLPPCAAGCTRGAGKGGKLQSQQQKPRTWLQLACVSPPSLRGEEAPPCPEWFPRDRIRIRTDPGLWPPAWRREPASPDFWRWRVVLQNGRWVALSARTEGAPGSAEAGATSDLRLDLPRPHVPTPCPAPPGLGRRKPRFRDFKGPPARLS